jgi:hypothetical protein
MNDTLVYNTQLVMLKKIFKKKMISDSEYEIIKNKLMKKYKINGRFLA